MKEQSLSRRIPSVGSDGLGSKHAHCGLIALSLMLGGCAAIPGFGPPPVDAYDLSAPFLAQEGPRIGRRQVLVPEPTAIKILDGEDVVIRTASGSVQLLGGARWSDRLPRLVQSRLIQAYERSGRLGGVGRPGEGLAIDYQVIVEIRSFEVQAGNRHAYVELFVRVLDDRNGQVRASRSFVATAPMRTSGEQAYVVALDEAFHMAVTQIVDWSIATM